MDNAKGRYRRLLTEIPKLDCDIRTLKDHGKDPTKLEKILEDKNEELLTLSRTMTGVERTKGLLLVVSAPSGTGKTTICRRLLATVPTLRFSVSYTTRSPRRGERDGREYHFISKEDFTQRMDGGKFIEWAENYGHLYGTSGEDIENSLDKSFDILFDVDPRGAKTLRKNYPNGVFVFILPPSIDVLKERLTKRGSEKKDMMKIRIDKAVDEMKEVIWYDYVIFNDRIDTSVDILRSIYVAEKNKRERLQEKIHSLTT